MKTNKIALGAALWTLGIAMPVAHHVLIFQATVQVKPSTSYGLIEFYGMAMAEFSHLPVLLWIYLAAMWSLGTLLVVSGVQDKT